MNRMNLPPSSLHNGDRLDQPTFHYLYEKTPEGFHAQLIGGIVYVASPVHFSHSNPDGLIQFWLWFYQGETPGLGVINKTTVILGKQSEPEPDGGLFVLPSHGGSCQFQDGKTLSGAPELLVEIANSTASMDLNQKKADYEKAGVQEYVVVLCESETVVWYHLVKGVYEELEPIDGIYQSHVFPGLWLDPAGPFAANNSTIHTALRDGLASAEHGAFVSKLGKKAKGKKR
ncbi:MAG: Uma2 family endonuclease [Fimbriiglobus sp.]